jgi:hypothetical protein
MYSIKTIKHPFLCTTYTRCTKNKSKWITTVSWGMETLMEFITPSLSLILKKSLSSFPFFRFSYFFPRIRFLRYVSIFPFSFLSFIQCLLNRCLYFYVSFHIFNVSVYLSFCRLKFMFFLSVHLHLSLPPPPPLFSFSLGEK